MLCFCARDITSAHKQRAYIPDNYIENGASVCQRESLCPERHSFFFITPFHRYYTLKKRCGYFVRAIYIFLPPPPPRDLFTPDCTLSCRVKMHFGCVFCFSLSILSITQ